MAIISELETKRKKSLIAVCTFGLSEAPWGIIFSSSKEADRGMSFEGGAFGFIFRIIWFIVWSILTSAIMWIINIFRFIYYSVLISDKKTKEIAETRVSAAINDVWSEFDIVSNGLLGMNIHIKFEVSNMLNLTGNCNVYFYDKKKYPLKDTNQSYVAVDGQICTWGSYTPNYQNCIYNDFVLFIPYSELHLPQGDHKLKFQVQLFYNHEAIACSDFYDFTVNWQGEPQKTKPTDNKIRGKVNDPDIKSIIQKVINYTPDGSAVISIGELYVQFYAPNENTLYVEAVSEVYSPRVGDKDKEFRRIGYTIDRVSGKAMSNYHKEYSVSDLLAMINEIVYIFEEIYRVDFIDYKIDDNC